MASSEENEIPFISGSSVPLTLRIVSRMHSASSRAPVHLPEETVLRVDGLSFGIVYRGKTIGSREDNSANERLDRPAVLHEPEGELVEQLRMRRHLTGRAKVVRRSHETRAKEPVPDPVGVNACRQRVLLVNQPVGELAAATSWLDIVGASP